jgi:hypothetical protein
LWHFVLDGGALTTLLGLGVLGFSLSFGGDPHYLVAGFGGIILGLAIAAGNAHLRLGLLITTALAFGAYLLLGTALAVPDAAVAGFLPSLESLRTLLLGVVFSWKDTSALDSSVVGMPSRSRMNPAAEPASATVRGCT